MLTFLEYVSIWCSLFQLVIFNGIKIGNHSVLFVMEFGRRTGSFPFFLAFAIFFKSLELELKLEVKTQILKNLSSLNKNPLGQLAEKLRVSDLSLYDVVIVTE